MVELNSEGKTKAISQVDLKDFNVSEGNASAVLTETDIAVEKLIVDGLKKSFPDHCFIGEEGIGAEFPGKVIFNVNLNKLVMKKIFAACKIRTKLIHNNYFTASNERIYKQTNLDN